MTKVKLIIKLFLFNLLVVGLAFLLIEGISSTIIFYRTLQNTKPVAERLHTRYDPELGWVNIPNTTIENMYGPGLSVRINGQGFRNDEDFTEEIPTGKVRLICSGDSFTFSFGVDNNQTWCYLLSTLNPHWQTVNMGQGGYGIDQAYLWYKRDGARLKHNIQIFAFITADFDRMQRGIFLGYGKPILKVENDRLIIDNVPVPRQGFVLPWTTTPYQAAFDELRSVQLLRQTFFQNQDTSKPPIDEPAVQAVAEKILEDLVRLNHERNSTLVLVYLPVQASHRPDLKTDTRRRYISQGAAANDIVFIDLVEDFRKLSEDDIDELFIPNGAIDFPGAAGHYSAKGNEYIANRLYEELTTRPELAELLGLASN